MTVVHHTTVHSLEALHDHMLNGWEVEVADAANKTWVLKCDTLAADEQEYVHLLSAMGDLQGKVHYTV